MPSDAGFFLDTAGRVEYRLQLLPNKGGARDIAGEMPYIAYDINGKRIFRSLRSFRAGDDWVSRTDNPLYALNRSCTEANAHVLPAPKQR